ncbi:hypothetical protein FRC19_009397 [Serendipita sp. 401]|nr:hypothetical protein FRC19_009397 [Serendipita sp. 401]
MKNLKCRGEYADLFLSRSGSVPLTIILPYPIDESWDHITPEEFQLFFVRARTIRGFSLLFERTEPPAFSCPQLKSLYVEIRLDSQLDKALMDHTEIKHLSARLYDHRDQQVLLRQINPDHYGPRLRSMHLEDIRISAKTLMTYLLGFVALDQLSLRECYDPNHNLDNVITTLKPSRRRPFSFLSLKNCNNTFIGSFLHPQAPNGIVGTTDLVVSPEHPDLSYSPSIRRHDLVSSLRTNASKGIFMYIHEGGGKTWIETKHNALLYAPIPSYIPTGTIKSVICTGTRLLESRKFKRFSSLRELSFAFAKDGQGNSLGMVLNQTLVSGCPHLTYLRIQLLQTTSKLAKCRPGYTDDTELILPAFLEDWRSTYKQTFGHVLVEDEVNPERWGVMMDRIEQLVGIFEVRGNVIQEEDPELPSMELFELKEKPLPEGAITVDKFSCRASLW